MNSVFYEATTYWVLFVDLLLAVATLSLFKIGQATNLKLSVVGVLFLLLIGFLHWGLGGYRIFPADFSGALFYGLILLSATAVVFLFYLTSRNNFDQLSQEHIQLVQGLRVFVGGGFLMEGVLGVIPPWFSIMDGYFHIASGFLALVAAIAYVKDYHRKNALLWLANLVGLLDIIVIVTSICFFVWNELGPYHNMNYVVFGAGPVLLWLHFMSIRKLIHAPKQQQHYAYLPS